MCESDRAIFGGVLRRELEALNDPRADNVDAHRFYLLHFKPTATRERLTQVESWSELKAKDWQALRATMPGALKFFQTDWRVADTSRAMARRDITRGFEDPPSAGWHHFGTARLTNETPPPAPVSPAPVPAVAIPAAERPTAKPATSRRKFIVGRAPPTKPKRPPEPPPEQESRQPMLPNSPYRMKGI